MNTQILNFYKITKLILNIIQHLSNFLKTKKISQYAKRIVKNKSNLFNNCPNKKKIMHCSTQNLKEFIILLFLS